MAKLSLRARLLIGGITAVVAVLITAGVGLFGMMDSNEGLKTSITATSAVLNAKQADMMHDALRADVLYSINIGPDGDPAEKEAVTADTAEHIQSFEDSMNVLRGLELPPEVRVAVDEVTPKLVAYIAEAKASVPIGLTDTAAARAKFPDFMVAFSDLEERMGVLGEQIEAYGNSAGGAAVATNRTLSIILAVVSLLAVITMIASNWIIAGSISRPILGMIAAMKRLASGDRNVDIPGLGRGDEVGQMAEAVQVFKNNAIETDRLSTAQARDQQAREQRTQQLEALCRDFDRLVTKRMEAVIGAVGDMENTAQSMSRAAEDTAAEAGHVSQSSEAASSNVNAVAAATEELAASSAEIGQQMSRSREIAGQAAGQAVATNAQIKQLADAAQKIGAVVQLITDIASQTNLLALNATIEAARAGEAGKGFAVVASEVKNLATQTGKATDEISQQINGIQTETHQAVNAIESIASTINEINQITGAVAAAVEEQAAATKEIARSVEQAATGTQDTSTRIMNVTSTANQTGVAAGQLLGSSSSLAKEARDLRQEIETFLSTIRAM